MRYAGGMGDDRLQETGRWYDARMGGRILENQNQGTGCELYAVNELLLAWRGWKDSTSRVDDMVGA
jgi:hypothetical protein